MMSDRLRVLAVCHEDPAHILGGMGMHVRELYRAMGARGDVEIDLLTSGPGEGSQPYFPGFTRHMSDKLICFKPREPNLAALLSADIQLTKTFTRLLAEGRRWDVLHVHEWNSLQVARLIRDTLDLPMVGTMHLCMTKLAAGDKVENYSEGHLYMLTQEGALVCGSDELILCSRAYERIAREQFHTNRPINVIYNGIRRDEWCRDRGVGVRATAKHNIPPRQIVLFVGRIADMKGIRVLLDAIERDDSGKRCYVIAGAVNSDSKEQGEKWDVTVRLREIEKRHPNRLRWVDFQYGQDLLDLYARADVGVMPSIHEPFGIAALEHMAMGVPLVATEVDGLGEIVCDGEGGEYALIIPPSDPGAILEALDVLEDKSRRRELRELGLKRVQAFNWDTVADQTVSVYKKVTRRA